jgi:signal transduction histidine kinase
MIYKGSFEFNILNRTMIASHLFLLALSIPLVMGWKWERDYQGVSNKQIRTYNRISFFFLSIGILGISYLELFENGNLIPFLILIVLINTLLISDPKKLLLKNLIAIGILGITFWINNGMNDFDFVYAISITLLISLTAYIGASMGIHMFVQEFEIQQNLSEQCDLLKHSLEREVNLRNAEIQMAVSSAKLNPHFIFNILNSIKLYIVKNSPSKAAEFLNKFANLIRITLRNANEKLIPLPKEIQFCKTYLELERFRLKEKFDYEIIKSSDLNPVDFRVPPLFCQVFLENAVWHGIMPKEYEDGEKGKILLSFKAELDHIIIKIEDNGMGRSRQNGLPKSSDGKKSMGLFLLRNRLDSFNEMYGTDAEFRLDDVKRHDGSLNGTRVTLKFPKIGGMVEMTA